MLKMIKNLDHKDDQGCQNHTWSNHIKTHFKVTFERVRICHFTCFYSLHLLLMYVASWRGGVKTRGCINENWKAPIQWLKKTMSCRLLFMQITFLIAYSIYIVVYLNACERCADVLLLLCVCTVLKWMQQFAGTVSHLLSLLLYFNTLHLLK